MIWSWCIPVLINADTHLCIHLLPVWIWCDEHNTVCPQWPCFPSLLILSDSKIGCASLLRGGILPSNNLSEFFPLPRSFAAAIGRVIWGQPAGHFSCKMAGHYRQFWYIPIIECSFYFIVVHLPGPVIDDLHIQGCSLELLNAVCFQTFMADIGGPPGFVSSP